jgi:hypothetical protein
MFHLFALLGKYDHSAPPPGLTFINLRAFMATLKFCLIWQHYTEAKPERGSLYLFPDKNLASFTIPDIK